MMPQQAGNATAMPTSEALTSLTSPPKHTRVKSEEMEEEAIVTAQAIQRVHHCIQSKGGNMYDALSERAGETWWMICAG